MKLWPSCRTAGPWCRLPSPKGGGSIEVSPAGCSSRCCSTGYHRRKAVAPLKFVGSTEKVGVGVKLPSPKGGGSIEVLSTWAKLVVGRSGLPSLKGGGSIEVTTKNRPTSSPGPSYHRRKAVAPLKLARPSGGCAGGLLLPSPKGGGSIEVCSQPSGLRSGTLGYHRRKAVAPLK